MSKEQFSYSKIETFKQCPYKYKLMYIDNHYINYNNISTEFGSLIHSIEEKIGNNIKDKIEVDYDGLINLFNSTLEEIKIKYSKDFYIPDKTGKTYEDKATFFIQHIRDFENRIKENNLEVIACEKEFFIEYEDVVFHGYIDRILKQGDTYIIEDIKTYSSKLSSSQLKTPLQFYIYKMAFHNISNNIKCSYDLPLCNCIQECEMDDEIDIHKLLEDIHKSDFYPIPTPLCYWCLYSETCPDQPKEAKGLCPYYSLWTKENKTKDVNIKWQGIKKDKLIVEKFRKKLI